MLEDSHDDDGGETLTLSIASVGVLSDSVATGTIQNHDPLALVARFGRTAAVHVVEQVEQRIEAPRGPGFEGRFAGRDLRRGARSNTRHRRIGRRPVRQRSRRAPGPSAPSIGVPTHSASVPAVAQAQRRGRAAPRRWGCRNRGRHGHRRLLTRE